MRRVLAFTSLILTIWSPNTVPIVQSALACGPDYAFIAARGSGESPQADLTDAGFSADVDRGMGKVLRPISDAITAAARAAGHSVESIALHYPAVPVSITNIATRLAGMSGEWGGPYEASVAEGAKTLVSLIERTHAECPTTRFLLGGYSQGAETIGRAIDLLSASQRSLIAATVLFGDPFFNPADRSADRGSFAPDRFGFWGERPPWLDVLSSPVHSYCRMADVICNVGAAAGQAETYLNLLSIGNWLRAKGLGLFAEHESYASGGDVAAAVQRLATDLGFGLRSEWRRSP